MRFAQSFLPVSLFGAPRCRRVSTSPAGRSLIRRVTVISSALICALLLTANAQARTDWRQYAQRQAARVGWTGAEWRALDAIVTPESGFDPCAYFPSQHDCGYQGLNSCGIPQANPCPASWRGRLDATGRAQVVWLLTYVRRRYGDPLGALEFRRANGWY